MSTDVAILIVTYNSEHQIEACLQSVFDQQGGLNQEVIVLDNNSADQTVSVVRAKFPHVKLVLPGCNLGFAAGVNRAAQQSNADYFLLLNPDTVVLDHAIATVVEFARNHPHYGLYGGQTLRPDGSLEPSSCWGMPSLWSLAMFATGLNMVARRNRILDPESLGKWPRDTVREVGVITGCFLLASRQVWTKLGGMDERYFLYGEDTDFSKRAHRAGFHPVIVPTARIVHEVGQSSATPTHKKLMLFRGKACFFRTHYTGAKRQFALFFLLAGVALRVMLSAVRFSFGPGKRSSSDWLAVWHQRHQWIQGFPASLSAGATSKPALGSSPTLVSERSSLD